jgi:hypothetical protein
MTTPLAWSGRDWPMPVWLWVGLATMFFSALHIILDFGVGLFDLRGTLSLTEATTLSALRSSSSGGRFPSWRALWATAAASPAPRSSAPAGRR